MVESKAKVGRWYLLLGAIIAFVVFFMGHIKVHAAESENLAYGKTVMVSSTESDEHAGTNAVDADGNTRWSSSYADEQNFIVDLGTEQKISSVKIAWEVAYASQYQIQVSNDNATWTTVYDDYNSS